MRAELSHVLFNPAVTPWSPSVDLAFVATRNLRRLPLSSATSVAHGPPFWRTRRRLSRDGKNFRAPATLALLHWHDNNGTDASHRSGKRISLLRDFHGEHVCFACLRSVGCFAA